MKKRNLSSQSLQKAEKVAQAGGPQEVRPEKKVDAHKHHNHCPPPRPLKKETSKHKKKQQDADTIKQLKAPIMGELRHLASNLINSSDRLAHLVKEEPKGPIQVYRHDRHKLIGYLNSLNVRPIAIETLAQRRPTAENKRVVDSFNQATLQTPNTSIDAYLTRQVCEIKDKIERAINRKRSKSSIAQLHAQLEGEVSLVKTKLEQLQKRTNLTRDQDLTSFIKLCKKLNEMNRPEQTPNNPESSELLGGELQSLRAKLSHQASKNQRLQRNLSQACKQIQKLKSNIVYIELLLFKSTHLLHEDISSSQQNQHYYAIDKQKMEILLKNFQEATEFIQSQSISPTNVMEKMKEEAQSMILQLRDLRKKSFQLLQEKNKALDSLRYEKHAQYREELQCAQLKTKIKCLNQDLNDLTQQIQNKEQIIDALKLDNNNLREDLKHMQDFIKQTKEQYEDRMQEINERIKSSESLLSAKDEHLNDLLAEIQARNKEIMAKMEEIQAKEEDIQALKSEYTKNEALHAKMVSTLSQEKKLLMLEKQRKENDLKQAENKLKFMEQESVILQKKIQNVFNGEEQYKYRIQTLEGQVKTLELQNQQLYKDMRSFENDQENTQESKEKISKANRLLQEQIISLKGDLVENNKKLQFYEQKIVELAKLADTSFYDQIIQTQERRIHQLTKKLKQTHGEEIIEQSSDEAQQTQSVNKTSQEPLPAPSEVIINIRPEIHTHQSDRQLHQGIDYYPFLLQNRTPENRSRKSSGGEVIDYLTLSRNEEGGISVISSALSHYEIIVVNEQQDTIDVHKAVYPKSKRKQPSETHAIPPRSNYAEATSSSHSARAGSLHSNSNRNQPINPDYVQENTKPASEPAKEDNDNLSQASKQVNFDLQAKRQKMQDFNEEAPKVHTNASQIRDLIMSDPNTEKGEGQQHRLFKNVSLEHQVRADLRFSGQKETPSCIEQHSPKKQGTVYIRIRKDNSSLQTNTPRHRSRSCYNDAA